jgi:hypothetical protein
MLERDGGRRIVKHHIVRCGSFVSAKQDQVRGEDEWCQRMKGLEGQRASRQHSTKRATSLEFPTVVHKQGARDNDHMRCLLPHIIQRFCRSFG